MKPHIQKKGGVWWCGSAKGLTLEQAYDNYLLMSWLVEAYRSYDRMWREEGA